MSEEVIFFRTAAEDVHINERELAARLKTNVGFENEILDKCRKKLMESLDYKCAYIRCPVGLSQENVCDFGFMTIKSKSLYKNLLGCSEAFVIAVTTGIAADRILVRLNAVSQAEHYMTDALSSAAVESFCDYACDKISAGINCANRFSPGYGDVSIEFQKPLLTRLNAQRLLGITLNQAYLMTPVKSITAIMGIRQEQG